MHHGQLATLAVKSDTTGNSPHRQPSHARRATRRIGQSASAVESITHSAGGRSHSQCRCTPPTQPCLALAREGRPCSRHSPTTGPRWHSPPRSPAALSLEKRWPRPRGTGQEAHGAGVPGAGRGSGEAVLAWSIGAHRQRQSSHSHAVPVGGHTHSADAPLRPSPAWHSPERDGPAAGTRPPQVPGGTRPQGRRQLSHSRSAGPGHAAQGRRHTVRGSQGPAVALARLCWPGQSGPIGNGSQVTHTQCR